MSDRFSDVNDFCPTWDCRFKGKGDSREALQPEKSSHIIGHYIGSREATIKNNNHTIHKVRVMECGNHEHLSEPLTDGEPKEYEFFGTFVINAILADPSKVSPGDCILIKWLGKVEPKTKTGRKKPYDSWKVFQDNDTPKITVKDSVIIADGASSDNDIIAAQNTATEKADTPPAPQTETATNTAEVPDGEEEDDDLPF